MRKIFTTIVAGLLFAVPFTAKAQVNILACEPEWAALAEEIGGPKISTFSATHARQDPHHIRARPSLIAKARRADLIICSGAGLEVGWLPILLQKSGPQVQPNALGHVTASHYVPLLDTGAGVDRSMGDVHPEGNPHIHLNPHHILPIAAQITDRLAQLDSANADYYQNRYQDFAQRWQQALAQWEAKAAPLKGTQVVVHHKSFSYLIDWLQLRAIASLEPKPGIPPTSSHLESLLQQLKATPAKLILRTPYEPEAASLWLSSKTNIPALVLPYTIGGVAEAGDLFALYDATLALLLENANVE